MTVGQCCRNKIFYFFFVFFIFNARSFAGEGGKQMEIRISGAEFEIKAELNDTATSKDLWASLPVRLRFYPLQNREFYAPIALEIEGSDVRDGYEIGDIGYWTGGDTVVLYYGEGWTGDLIIMGRMTSDFDFLRTISEPFDAVIEKIGE